MFLALAGHGAGQSYNITPATILDFAIDPSTALAGIVFHHNGSIQSLSPSAANFHDDTDWLIPHRDNVGALYEVRFINSVNDPLTTAASTVNNWVNISAARTYSILSSGIGTESAGQTFEIRRISDSVTVASGLINLEHEIESGG